MVEGWKPVPLEAELYKVMKTYYEENKEDLKLTEGIRSVSAFICFCLREQLKKLGAIRRR